MRKKRINPFWLSLSILLSAVILVLCFFAGRGGTLRLEADGDAQEVVSRFFNAVTAANYPEAYACLSDYSALGLENEPDSPTGRTLRRALQESYGFTLVGDCVVDKLSAVQRVDLRALDLKAVESAVAQEVDAAAEELVAERPTEEIYDENMQYLPSFTDEIYEAALARVLNHAQDFYATTPLELTLEYTGGAWKMRTSPALFNALMGNA